MKDLIVPNRLKPGDEVRVVSPALSMSIIAPEVRKLAISRLQEMGLKVSFSKNVEESDEFTSSSIHSRVDDLHEAFVDPNVKGILTTIGGHNSNQLLSFLDYDLIRKHPKIFCGYSDLTALQNAILAKSGLVTYSGPHFSTFGCLKGMEYTLDHFQRCMFSEKEISIVSSSLWSDDAWYLDQENRHFEENSGFWVMQEGAAEGRIIGANLCTLNLLQGTAYMPSLKDSILFLEDDYLVTPAIFDRDLQSLIHQKDFSDVKGLVIGRFQRASKMTVLLLQKIIDSKKELKNLPIIANADFGHTQPMFTFPVGGFAKLNASKARTSLQIKS